MSYERKHTTDSGVEVGHWMLASRHVNYLNRTVTFSLAGYVSEDACNNGRQPLYSESYTINAALMDPDTLDAAACWAYAAKTSGDE